MFKKTRAPGHPIGKNAPEPLKKLVISGCSYFYAGALVKSYPLVGPNPEQLRYRDSQIALPQNRVPSMPIYLQPALPRRNLRISDLTDGNEARIFAALGIMWPPGKGHTIKCPFPDHDDEHPSWRWDAQKRLYACSCADPMNGRHGGDLADVVRRCAPEGLADTSLGGIAKWLRDLLARPIADEPVKRAAGVAPGATKAGLKRRARQSRRTSRPVASRPVHRAGPGACLHRGEADCALRRAAEGQEAVDPGARHERRGGERATHLARQGAPKPEFIKRFVKDSRVGGAFHIIGGGGQSAYVIFCEGWATGCSLHQATGLPVVVCFSAAGIASIATAFRQRCPTAQFILAADNDPAGIDACQRAAAAISNARVVVAAGVGNKGDFNDIHVKNGLDEVARQIQTIGA